MVLVKPLWLVGRVASKKTYECYMTSLRCRFIGNTFSEVEVGAYVFQVGVI